MSYCLNPQCEKAQNPEGNKFCQNCGSKLLLGERYRAIKPIGEGSFSKTFLAVDEEQGKRHCVIKQFGIQAPNAADPLRQELKRLETLGKHPQISQMLAHFERDHRQYFVQEFIDGRNLAQQLAEEGALNEEQIRELLTEVLPVLQFLHEAQLIHRDIKPENLIRRRSNNQWVLVGFGATKHATQTALAKTGTLIGSAEYAAPEQLRGKAIFSSDLYSLAVTCIHSLTEIHPFDLYDCMEGTWIWRDYAGNRVSAQLARILDKMLQGTASRRYQSAADVLQDLHPGVAAIRKVKIPEKGKDESTSLPNSLAFNAQTSPPPEEKEVPVPVQFTAPTAPPPKPLPSWKCEQTLMAANSSVEVTSIAFSPQSRMLASGSWDTTIKLWDLDNITQPPAHTLTKHAHGVTALAISQNGQILVSGSADCTITVWQLWQLAPAELKAGTIPVTSLTLAGHTNMVTAVAISPDGKTLATGSRDCTIKLWNLQTGELQQTIAGHSERVTSVIISANGETLASADADGTIKIWQLNTGELLGVLTDHAGAVNAIAMTPDGKTLVSGSWDRTVKIWNLHTDLETGKLSTSCRTLSGHLLSVATVAISLDGKTLATGSYDATIKLWNLAEENNQKDSPSHTLAGHSKAVTSLAFSPDSKTLASGSADGTLKLWRS